MWQLGSTISSQTCHIMSLCWAASCRDQCVLKQPSMTGTGASVPRVLLFI